MADWSGRQRDFIPSIRLTLSDDIKAPVLGLYGGADREFPSRRSKRCEGAQGSPGRPPRSSSIPRRRTRFFADYRPSYRKDKAEDGWKRMLEWFKKNGVS